MDAQTLEEVVRRLAAGVSLEGLGLQRHQGRWDLRGTTLGRVRTGKLVNVGGTSAQSLDGVVELRGVVLRGLDLSGARWEHLRMFDVSVEDCVFDAAQLRDLRVWGTKVSGSSFANADLRDASFGGTTRRSGRSSWVDVDLARADLRGSVHADELYQDCSFALARLDRVSFAGARHVRSTFEGTLREVSFHRHDPLSSVLGRWRAKANEMLDVDLSRTTLRSCEFWQLSLAHVRLPVDDQHIVYAPKVDVARQVLSKVTERDLNRALVNLCVYMEGAIQEGPADLGARGVIHRDDLGETSDERAAAADLLSTVLQSGGRSTF